MQIQLNLALHGSFLLQWRGITAYFIAVFFTKCFPKLWGVFFQCLKNRMENLKEHLWELSLVLLITSGSRKMPDLVLSLLRFLSNSETKTGQKMGKILQAPHGEFHLNTLLGCFQLCSWDHKKQDHLCDYNISLSSSSWKAIWDGFIFYYLKWIVTQHVTSIILCSLYHWTGEKKIWNLLCECFNILSKRARSVRISLDSSTSYSTGKIYVFF